jgi:hypothetical protein
MAGETAVVLHLGAHKTASTHLQQALKRARPEMATRVLVPDDLRKDGLRLQDWLHPGVQDAAHEGALRAAFAGAGRLVISEENILGQVPGVFHRGAGPLYPRAGERLQKLARVLPPGPVTLALALREGTGFLASCYSQALMAGRVAPYGVLFGALDPVEPGWDGLVDALMAALPGATVVIWDHADWPAVAPEVGALLLGSGAPALRLPSGRSHPGLTAPAVAALLAEAPSGAEIARARARELRALYPREDGHPPCRPHDATTMSHAAAAHSALMARLAARPGVRCLRPAG